MITRRPSDERGRFELSWLRSRHTFSFGEYYDPSHMGFGPLRVINEDHVAPGGGFPRHGHRDMEILTYVLDGGLAHRDSLGTGATIRPGEVQIMSAGTGLLHSEYNASTEAPVHFLQIWMLPARMGLAPRYEQKLLTPADGGLRLIGSPDGRDGSVTIHQDIDLHAGHLAAGNRVTYAPRPGRLQWLQVARGAVSLNGVNLAEGDGAAIAAETALDIIAASPSEILLFDMTP